MSSWRLLFALDDSTQHGPFLWSSECSSTFQKRAAASCRRLWRCVLVRLDWPALTPALTEIRLFDRPVPYGSLIASSQRPTPNGICGLAASWLFNPRRQAHFLRVRHKLVCPMPNVFSTRFAFWVTTLLSARCRSRTTIYSGLYGATCQRRFCVLRDLVDVG